MGRNPDLDKELKNDHLIGNKFIEDGTEYRVVNGRKISQIEEKTQRDIDMNLIINRSRMERKED